jgi:hypothetical protein
MAANNEIRRRKITVDGEAIEVLRHRYIRACQSSLVLQDPQTEPLSIPARDIAGRNFNIAAIELFFEVFDDEAGTWDPQELDSDSLVQLCHVFWWLKCDTSALRSSPAVKRLRDRIQADSWASTEPRCTHRLVVSLVLCWKEELTASCNELMYKSIDNQDNLFEELPGVTCKYSSGNRMYTY